MSDRLSLDEALAALNGGQVVGLPTDTVYGIAASITNPEALAALFVVKDRPDNIALPILVDSYESARALGVTFDERAIRLADQFWPGALTVIIPASPELARSVHSERDVVGIRVPNDRTMSALLERSGPLAVTSANAHGAAPCTTADEVLAVFSGRVEFAGVVDDGPRDGAVSTVVDLSDSELRIVRHGALSESLIVDALTKA